MTARLELHRLTKLDLNAFKQDYEQEPPAAR